MKLGYDEWKKAFVRDHITVDAKREFLAAHKVIIDNEIDLLCRAEYTAYLAQDEAAK